jgi:hypothetical protein
MVFPFFQRARVARVHVAFFCLRGAGCPTGLTDFSPFFCFFLLFSDNLLDVPLGSFQGFQKYGNVLDETERLSSEGYPFEAEEKVVFPGDNH